MAYIICARSALELESRLSACKAKIATPCDIGSLDVASGFRRGGSTPDLDLLIDLISKPSDDSGLRPGAVMLEQGRSEHRSCEDSSIALAKILKAANRPGTPPSLNAPKLDILVTDDNMRHQSRCFHSHAWSGTLPDGSLFRLTPDIAVTCPELALIQVVWHLDPIAGIALLNEACGFYGCDQSERGMHNRVPLTNPMRLRSFALKFPKVKGAQRILKLLPCVAERSRSPMETSLSTIMRLPPRSGGFGFDDFVLNHVIPLDATTARMAGISHAEIDFFFPTARVGLEYNSNLHHTGPDRIAKDSRRNDALRYMGINLITLTWQQVRSIGEFEDVMRQLCKYLGKRFRPLSKSSMEKRKALWEKLFQGAWRI